MKFIQVGLSLFSFSFKLNDLSLLLLISMTLFFFVFDLFFFKEQKMEKKICFNLSLLISSSNRMLNGENGVDFDKT